MVLLLVGFCALLLVYVMWTYARPVVVVGSAPVPHLPKFIPSPLLMSGHLQTIYSAVFVRPRHMKWVAYERETVPVRAGRPGLHDGAVALDWAPPGDGHELTPTTPVLLVLHGLTGGSRGSYVLRMVNAARDQLGFRVVAMNARGCGGSKLLSPQAFCGAYTDDVRQVVRLLAERFPDAPIFAVGYSLGANILVKYMGEEGDACPLAAAVAVANPWDLEYSSYVVHNRLIQRLVYCRPFASSAVKLFRQHEDAFRDDTRIDMKLVLQSKTMREFDDRFTRVTFGYDTVDDYYRDASSDRFLPKNPNVTLVATPGGGHSMCWLEGCRTLTSWSVKVIVPWLASKARELPVLSHSSES